jgi:hypothetical protein
MWRKLSVSFVVHESAHLRELMSKPAGIMGDPDTWVDNSGLCKP